MNDIYNFDNIFHPWDECKKVLNDHFIFDKVFDLIQHNELFETLKEDLKKLKKDQYDVNYRFVFLHYDTDYYIYPNIPGILITNLQKILVDLDIPNFCCLIITNHTNLKIELEYLRENFTQDQYPIGCIVSQLQNCHVTHFNKLKKINLNINLIKKHYLCFNRSKRNHRKTLISLLHYNQLLHKGLVSYVK